METNQTNKQENYSSKDRGNRFSEFVADIIFDGATLMIDTVLRVDEAIYETGKSDWGHCKYLR